MVLATLIFKGVRLPRAGRLVTNSPVYTYIHPFPIFSLNFFYLSLFNSVAKIKIFLSALYTLS